MAECIGRGPAWPDNIESCRIIASKQAEAAEKLLDAKAAQRRTLCSELRPGGEGGGDGDDACLFVGVGVGPNHTHHNPAHAVRGVVDSRHVYLDMRNLTVRASPHTRAGATCAAAMGMAFAAGTTDGPGAFDFHQSDTNGTAFWRLVRNFIRKPTPEQEACHAPKPILLDVGEMHFPYEWAPAVVEIQILRVGPFLILAVPGELTTMAGRRLRAAVRDVVRMHTCHGTLRVVPVCVCGWMCVWLGGWVGGWVGGEFGPAHSCISCIHSFNHSCMHAFNQSVILGQPCKVRPPPGQRPCHGLSVASLGPNPLYSRAHATCRQRPRA